MTVRRGFGEGSSPAIQGDTLIVTWDHQGESFIVALDRTTGDEKWRTAREEITSWTTPLIVAIGDGYQVVTSATERVRGYDLETGNLLWESPGLTLNAIPSPVAAEGVVFVTSGYRGSVVYAVQLDRARGDLTGGDAIVWSGDRDTPYVPSPLLYDGTLYLIKGNSGILSAIDAKSGERNYIERLDDVPRVYASPVAGGGRIYIPGRDGGTLVLASGPEFEVLAFNELDDGFDASPALVDSEIYLRGKRWLYRISTP
jgi:outer membrane protein assembly factor BamB